MRKLSRTEWIAVAVAVIFVVYTLFGGDILDLFRKNAVSDNSLPTITSVEFSKEVIINDILVGRGGEIKAGDLASVDYILSLSDGTVIQNSKDFGAPFKFVFGTGQVIPGWEQGLAGMRVGGVRTIIIPPSLAYGSNQVGPIPPNSTLIFTIELLEISEAPTQ